MSKFHFHTHTSSGFNPFVIVEFHDDPVPMRVYLDEIDAFGGPDEFCRALGINPADFQIRLHQFINKLAVELMAV